MMLWAFVRKPGIGVEGLPAAGIDGEAENAGNRKAIRVDGFFRVTASHWPP
jgi:hypothetical protein